MIIAAKGVQKDIVEALVAKGPNVNAVDQDGITALGYAAHAGDITVQCFKFTLLLTVLVIFKLSSV